MVRIQAVLARFANDEKGTSALGYALLAALVAFILIGAVETLGANLGTVFAGVANSVSGTAARQTATVPAGLACGPATTAQPPTGQCQPDHSYPGITG